MFKGVHTPLPKSLFLFPVIIDDVTFTFVQAEALINMEGSFVTNTKAKEVSHLYDNLLEYDKQPLKYHPMYQQHSLRSRFARKYCSGHVGIESMKR